MQTKSLTPDLLARAWEIVGRQLPSVQPAPKGGRPRASDQVLFAAIVDRLWNRRRWRDLPAGCPSRSTCWRRLREWREAGLWTPAWQEVVTFLNRELGMNRFEHEFRYGDRPAFLDVINGVSVGRGSKTSAVSPADRADD